MQNINYDVDCIFTKSMSYTGEMFKKNIKSWNNLLFWFWSRESKMIHTAAKQ